MKRIISLLTVITVLCCLFACSTEGQLPAEQVSAQSLYDEIRDRYGSGCKLTSYKEVAALRGDAAECDYSELLRSPDREAKPMSEYLLSLLFLKLSGCNVQGTETDYYVELLKERINECDKLDTVSLSLAVTALRLYNADFDKASVANSLSHRQDKITFSFYHFPQTGHEKATASVIDSAYALMAYLMIRDDIRTAVYEDELHDGTLIYLGNQIDNNNLVCDDSGKESVVATSTVLSALIAAGIPLDGEISTALSKAISDFAVKTDGRLVGYKEYTNGEMTENAIAEAAFAASCTVYGHPFIIAGINSDNGVYDN